jgi:hypothetical protein
MPVAHGGADNMSQTTETTTYGKAYPLELEAILERANLGDESALAALKQALDAYPELTRTFGDLAAHAEMALLRLVAGPSLVAKEAIARQVAELRARLAVKATSELEKLLIDRIAISWIEVYHGDLELAQQLLIHCSAGPATAAAQKRLDRAHARFLAAIKALAIVQKLVRPMPSVLELLAPPVPDTASVLRNRGGSRLPAGGVPVLN